MRAEASSAHNRLGASTLQFLSSLPQLKQELLYHYLLLDASAGDAFLSTVYDVCLDEGEMKACSQVSVDTGDTSLVRSGSPVDT